MKNYNGFGVGSDPEQYWWAEDSLHSLDYDLQFSPMRRYLCLAGCKVCYIQDNFDSWEDQLAQTVPDRITDEDTELWLDVFNYFSVVNTNDDMRWLKENHRTTFQWYQEHAHRLKFSMSDSAILYQHRVLLDDMSLAGLQDISLSDTFVEETGVGHKLKYTLILLAEKYPITKIKFIISNPAGPSKEVVEMLDYLQQRIPSITAGMQHEFSSNENTRFDLAGKFTHQNTHMYSYMGKVLQIHRESVHLYNRDFYFTCDDASTPSVTPIHTIGDKFRPQFFLPDLLSAKLTRYAENAKLLSSVQNPRAQAYAEYFREVHSKIQVNSDFSMIPNVMLDPQSQFYFRLFEQGWRTSEQALFKPTHPVIPLCSHK